jgi:UDP-N-acetyl-D-galactosamine dehydrogenase
VVDLIVGLQRYGMDVVVVDPWVNPEEAQREYGLTVNATMQTQDTFGAVVAAVAHHQFSKLTLEQWRQLLHPDGVTLDLKGIVPRQLDPIRI